MYSPSMTHEFALRCATLLIFVQVALGCQWIPLDDDEQPTPEFPALTDTVQVSREVVVCEVDGIALHADIARPTRTNHRRRATLLVHGGGWSTGTRADFDFLLHPLANVGITAVTVDYRLSPLVEHPQHVEDVKCALRWLRTHAAALDVDPEKLAVIGASAGAHLAAFIAYTPDDPGFEGDGSPADGGTRVAATVLHGGPHDLTHYAEFTDEQQGAIRALLASGAPTDEQLRAASPVEYVRPGAVPTLILHGESDPVVPPNQAQLLSDALTSVGATNRVLLIPGAGHSDFGSDPDAIANELLSFLQEALN